MLPVDLVHPGEILLARQIDQHLGHIRGAAAGGLQGAHEIGEGEVRLLGDIAGLDGAVGADRNLGRVEDAVGADRPFDRRVLVGQMGLDHLLHDGLSEL